jgi:hypothetical protein
MHEMNIYDLTEQESTSSGLPHTKLLIEALLAISQEQLGARFGDSAQTVRSFVRPGFIWCALVRQGVTALERDPHFFVPWFRFIFVDLNDYSRWRNEAKQKRKLVARAGQKLLRPNRKHLLAAVAKYIDSEHSQGRQASQKRLWTWAMATLPGATHNQVVEAMRVVEGGRQKRGRPRKVAAAAPLKNPRNRIS